MRSCAICCKSIGDRTGSGEHLILNAIGGRRKVFGVLCASCNHTSGAQWDSELARQLNPLALLVGVVRDQGEVPAQKFQTLGGREFWLYPDGSLALAGSPYRKTPSEDGRAQIQIRTSSMPEFRRVLKGVAQKYPEVDYETALASADIQTQYLDEALKLTLTVGGDLAGRSIVKSALCLAVASGVDPLQCTDARAYLGRNEPTGGPFGFYCSRDLVAGRPRQTPLHCVAVSNRGCDGQLLGYVEFFGFHRIVVCLAANYPGSDVHASYAVNPMTGDDIELDVRLELSRAEVGACLADESIHQAAYAARLDELMPVVQKRSFELERDRVARSAIEHAFRTCGVPPGGELPLAKAQEFSRLVAEQMMPFVRRHLVRGGKGGV